MFITFNFVRKFITVFTARAVTICTFNNHKRNVLYFRSRFFTDFLFSGLYKLRSALLTIFSLTWLIVISCQNFILQNPLISYQFFSLKLLIQHLHNQVQKLGQYRLWRHKILSHYISYIQAKLKGMKNHELW